MTDDLSRLDATAQAELVRSGAATPSELVEAAIERIERINPALNAVIGDRFDRARTEAAGELPDGPFRGVPFLVKDLSLTMADEPYYAGTRFLKEIDHHASVESYLARKFRESGLVTLGRTNTPEWGSTITTEPVSFGPSRNPWNLEHSTGGSSGGSAAAVAAGLVPIAHANDGGGSIRIPASECGLVGLKPSRGRVSHGPAAGDTWMGATIEGVVTRSVRDAARALDAIQGEMPGDPYTAPLPGRSYIDELGEDPGALRIGFLDHPPLPGGVFNQTCAAAVASALQLLGSLGHRIEDSFPAAIAEEQFASTFTTVVAAWTAHDIAYWEGVIGRTLGPDDLEHDNLMLGQWGRKISAPEYLQVQMWMHAWSRRTVEWWSPADGSTGFDLLVTPTLGTTPPKLGVLGAPGGMVTFRELMQYTSQVNLSGQPAVSLPLYWSADGLPVGVQLVAAPYREDVLLRVAAQLEAARPWAGHLPTVHA